MDDTKTAEILNNYFTTVFTKEDKSNIPEPSQIFDTLLEPLIDIKIDEALVYHKLKNLNVNKCPGSDNIHPKMLYELKNEIAAHLTKLYNMSVETGEIPQDFKDANVAHLF